MSDQRVDDSALSNRRSRVVLSIYLAAFVAAAIGMTVYGFKVVSDVKARARLSDAALRLVAWQILVYSDREGVFPTEEPPDLAGLGTVDRLDGALAADSSAAWPFDRAAAGDEIGVDIDPSEAATIVIVSWPPSSDLPPVLGVGGRPSGLVPGGTTLELVNGWLRAARDQLGRD